MVKAKIERDADGVYRIICKRAKYKHWHELGKHRETDMAFQQALRGGALGLCQEIHERSTLFSNSAKNKA